MTSEIPLKTLDFHSVTQAWDRAGEEDIHPLWNISEDDYWASGRAQADQIAEWVPKGATVIDFGCGNGRLTIPLAQAGYKVIAVDSSPTMLQRLRVHASTPGQRPSFRTIESDGSDLAAKLGKTKADAVVARAVLIHHDYAGVEDIVVSLTKALKKGGHLIADWPVGEPQERHTWISVTQWDAAHRLAVAEKAGLVPVHVTSDPSVWRKA
jgi:2-polyprenyl-3-methyl-5-hydroxy-6-metoxy-1,4-benzoquinol methylase